jgi:hypothetical protein
MMDAGFESPHLTKYHDSARRVIRISAILTAVFSGLYLLGLVGKLIVDGTVHSVSAQPLPMISAYIAILLDLSLLVQFTAQRARFAHSLYADLGWVFMILTCASSTVSWFVQLALVPGLAGDLTLLALLDIHEPHSLMYAIEHLGWGVFYGLALVFMAIPFGGSNLARWIRGLMMAGGTLSLIHVIGAVASFQPVADLGYIAWGFLLPVTAILLARKSAV